MYARVFSIVLKVTKNGQEATYWPLIMHK